MTGLVDYGVGNLFSLASSLEKIGEKATVSADADFLLSCDRILLPGVGAFRDAAEKLFASGLVPALEKAVGEGKPLLGICLGMQLLFEKSEEYGETRGLGFLKGKVTSIRERCGERKIPHMGWNALQIVREHPLLSEVRSGEYVYFVHSFSAVDCEDSLLATAEYGAPLTAAVGMKNVMGCQFHPEKSGTVGLSILRAFCKMKGGTPC